LPGILDSTWCFVVNRRTPQAGCIAAVGLSLQTTY